MCNVLCALKVGLDAQLSGIMKLKRPKWGQSLPRQIAVTRSLADRMESISASLFGCIITGYTAPWF